MNVEFVCGQYLKKRHWVGNGFMMVTPVMFFGFFITAVSESNV